jgi:hypothetical protein
MLAWCIPPNANASCCKSVFGKGEGLNLLRSWGTQRTFLNSFSYVETLRNVEDATRQNGSHEALLRAKEADLASSSLTLSLTKQALRAHQ